MLAVIAAAVLLGPAGAAAQSTTDRADPSEGPLYSLRQDDARMGRAGGSATMLQRRVSVDLDEVPFKRALHEVAQRSGFGLSYSSNLVPTEKIVSVHVERRSVAEVLRALIEDTNLKVLVSPRREILVVEDAESMLLKDRPWRGGRSGAKIALPEVPVLDLSALGATTLQREQVTITGTVTNSETGETLPGVNVVVENTTIGTATDAGGAYTLDEVPQDAETLVFSSIGFATRRVAIDGRSSIDVALDPDVSSMEEVVVVGYGTQQRGDVTGAVSSVQVADVQDIPVTSFEESIQGKLPGVQIQQTSGEPGASPQVQVRGTGSITAGNNPLYVIDGLPISRNTSLQGSLFRRRAAFTPPTSNPLAAINPNDIESIEVLKDASSAAIYGSRGSNGVVLVTTKTGAAQDDGPSVQFNSYVGRQEAAHLPDLMNAEELIDYAADSRNNNYLQKYHPLDPDSPDYNPNYDPMTNEGRPSATEDGFVRLPEKYVNYDGDTDTDWLDLVLDPALMASTNLSVAGGGEDVNYYVSGGYLNQQGTIEGSGYQRYSLRANVEATPYERLQVGTHLNLSLARQDRLPAGSPYFARPPGIIYSAMVHSPVIEPYNDDGPTRFNQLHGQSYLGGGTTSASNPLAIMNSISEDLDNHRTFGNAFAEYELVEGLTLRSSFGADLVDYTRSFFRGNSLLYRTAKEGQPYAQSSSSRSFNWTSENTLNYSGTFSGDHELTATAGFTAQREHSDLNSIIARNFPDDDVKTINAGQVTDGTSRVEEWSLLSYLARANYSYRGRYLLTATVRADQSSRFGAGNRTGVFPSVSVGWRVHEEPFMDGVDAVSTLKPRLSYGVTGNFLIPNYASYSLLRKESYNFGGDVNTATVPATLGDEDLTWETTRQFNAGLDLGLFDSRLYFSADYYYSRTSDLLLNVTLPSAVGYKSVLTNIGVVENQGFELAVTSYNFTGGDLTWTTDLNFATNRNEVLELGQSGDPILSVGGAGIRHITRIGNAVGSYYGYVVDGIYQSEEEIENAPDDHLAPDPQPGDFRFKDVNGDGQITADDRTVTGSYQPDFTYGLTNTLSYKGLDLSVFIQGVEGRDILNLTARHLKNGEANFNSYDILNERWRSSENPGNGEVPRADRQTGIHGNNNRPSSYQVEDGSYVRLRNVTLGYELPPSLLGGVLNRARVYVSGKNLLTLTDYIGFNPEVNNEAQSSLTPGEDYGAYPISRTYTFGVNLRF